MLYKIIRWHSECILGKGHNCFTADVQERSQLIEKGYFIHLITKWDFKNIFHLENIRIAKLFLNVAAHLVICIIFDVLIYRFNKGF